MFREKGSSTTLAYKNEDMKLGIQLSGEKCPHILRITLDHKPEMIELDDNKLIEGSDFEYNVKRKNLSIRTTTYENGLYQIHL